jgi:hypothetical protein
VPGTRWTEPVAQIRIVSGLAEISRTGNCVEGASGGGSDVHNAIETLLKGVEVELPLNIAFKKADGHVRHDIRTRW